MNCWKADVRIDLRANERRMEMEMPCGLDWDWLGDLIKDKDKEDEKEE